MAYLHCHNCGWDNDDFFEDYGGHRGMIRRIKEDLSQVINPYISPYKKNYTKWDGRKNWTKITIGEFKLWYRLYFKQEYKTFKQFREENPEWICPVCGEKELDVD